MTHKKKPGKRPPGSASKRPGRVRSRASAGEKPVKKARMPTKKAPHKKQAEKTPPRKPARGTRAGAGTEERNTAPSRRDTYERRSSTQPAQSPTLSYPPKRKKKEAPSFDPGKHVSEQENDPDETSLDDPYPLIGDDITMLGIGSPVFLPTADLDESEDEDDSEHTFPLSPSDPSVETRIREIEERLDGLMAADPGTELDGQDPPSEVFPESDPDSAVDSAREVLQSAYYRRNWGRGSLEKQSFDVDDFGMDPDFEEKLRPIVEFLYKRYFRVEVEGIRNVPSGGRALIVANHSGALPMDGVMLREAIRSRHPTRNDFRWLAEDFSFYLPFLGVAMNRIGAVRACQENAERLLEKEHLLGVFPEGAEGIKKLFRNRYRLQRFGRGGFVRLSLKTGSPMVPCAVIGAEETNPIVYRFDNLSKLLGLDYLPITPTFPALGPLGLLPAPTKWRIVFGEPIFVDEYGPQAAQDHVLVGRLAERVRSSISQLLETGLRRRKSIWF